MTTISERIRQFNSDRIPEYTALKYKMMNENAFRFFRGTCHLFYEDLAKNDKLAGHPVTWICGDLHLENFGSYKGNNRLVYFDLNDYDEAALCPASWELCRMVTSIITGFDSLQIDRTQAVRVAKIFLKKYAQTLAFGKALYIEPQTARGIVKTFLRSVSLRKQKTLLRQRAVLKSRTEKPGLIINNVRVYKLVAKKKKELAAHLNKWMKTNPDHRHPYRVTDVSFRIAGTGSIGVKRYVFLVQHIINPKKYLLIDMKQAKPSSVQPFFTIEQPAWASEADRVVAVQRRMQNIAPALLGSTTYLEDSYVIKELQPTADKINFLLIKNRYDDIVQVIEDMAVLTASAQLRSSGRQGSAIADELIAFGHEVKWQDAIIDYALHYAKQVRRDYASFVRDYKKGVFS